MGKVVAVCRWKNCNKATKSLIDHINRRHIGSGERKYVCEWENCVRRGKVFFKRPAIVKHMKCHTRPLGDGDWQVSEFSAATVAAKIDARERAKFALADDADLGKRGLLSRANLKTGDIVWARVQGYPWWPARVCLQICSPFENRETLTMLKDPYAPVGAILVRLLACDKLFWVPEASVLGYEEFYKDCSWRCALKLFNHAMQEASNDPSIHITEEMKSAAAKFHQSGGEGDSDHGDEDGGHTAPGSVSAGPSNFNSPSGSRHNSKEHWSS